MKALWSVEVGPLGHCNLDMSTSFTGLLEDTGAFLGSLGEGFGPIVIYPKSAKHSVKPSKVYYTA